MKVLQQRLGTFLMVVCALACAVMAVVWPHWQSELRAQYCDYYGYPYGQYPLPLQVIPQIQVVQGNTGGVVSFTLSGGFPPYTITTSNNSLSPVPAFIPDCNGSFAVVIPQGTPAQTVMYTATDSLGSAAHSTLIIMGNQAPVASFSYVPDQPQVGEEVTFDATPSYDPDGTVVGYQWNFGDGATAAGRIVTHAFTGLSKYTVSLTVTDNAGLSSSAVRDIDLTMRFDWRSWNNLNWISPVKDHALCGSSWAFAAIGAIESVYNVEQSAVVNIDLSEQNLVSTCYAGGDCRGMSASIPAQFNLLEYLRDSGIVDEACFPYRSQSCIDIAVTCTSACWDGTSCSNPRKCDLCKDLTGGVWTITDFGHIIGSDHDRIKAALVQYGPVRACGGGHCIVIVGWDNAKGLWIIKNSWGTGWANGGFGEIPYGHPWVSDAYYVEGVKK